MTEPFALSVNSRKPAAATGYTYRMEAVTG